MMHIQSSRQARPGMGRMITLIRPPRIAIYAGDSFKSVIPVWVTKDQHTSYLHTGDERQALSLFEFSFIHHPRHFQADEHHV
jgi:hypothetical protein